MEADSFQRCTAEGQTAMVSSCSKKNSLPDKKKFFSVKGDKLEPGTQRGCGISILGDSQNSTSSLEQPLLTLNLALL